MKEGWQIKTIGDVCTIISGQSPESNSYNDDRIGMPFYQGKKDFSEKYLSNPTNWTSSPTKESVYGDILMSVRAPVGSININHIGTICIGRGLAAIRTHNEQINSNYLYYYLESIHNAITGKEGAVFPSINKDGIITIPLPLPPLSEQQRIVDILDREFAKIDAVKSNAEQTLQNAKDLFQATLQQELSPKDGWNKKPLAELCEKVTNIKWNNVPKEKTFKYIDLTSVDRNSGIISCDLIINSANAPSRAKQIVKMDDIIFATTRPTLRRLSIITEELDNEICSTGFCVLRLNDPSVLPRWINYSLLCDIFYKYIKPLQNGANYPAVSDSNVKDYVIYYPSLTEQQKIITSLEYISGICRKVESNTKQIIAQCEALKQALLRKAFNGEL